MRRWICLLIPAIMLSLFLGCANEKTEYLQPVSVYYYRNQIAYNTADGVLASEIREFSGFENDLRGFLNQYLKGPYSDGLSSPFPTGGWILDLNREDTQIHVRLSMHFSQLSGKEQTIACACISKTIFALIDCESICLYIDGSQDSEDIAITITKEDFLLMDTTTTN